MSWVEFLPELHLRAINHRNTDVQSVTVVMTYNPGIQEAAAGKVRVSDECGLYSETLFQKIQGEREAGWRGDERNILLQGFNFVQSSFVLNRL